MEAVGKLELRSRQIDAIVSAIGADIAQQKYDGMALCVAHEGKIVMESYEGFATRDAGQTLVADNIFSVMSFTKPMTALANFQAIERGDISLTTRVCEVIPEFAANGKQRVTIAQLLSHTGGMPFVLPGLKPEDEGNLNATVAAACKIAPVNPPGSIVSYSAQVSYDVLGGVVQKLDRAGRTYKQIIEQDIFAPLEMRDSSIGAPVGVGSRRVPVRARNETEMNMRLAARDARLGSEAELPGGGAFSTLRDIHTFAEMLRNGGRLNGVDIVSPAMLDLATRNQTGDRPNNTLAAQRELRGWEPFPAFLGLGFFLRGTGLFPTPFGQLASPSTFGAIGAGSTVMWIDPQRDLSAVMLSSGLMDQVDSHLRFQRLSDMIHAALALRT